MKKIKLLRRYVFLLFFSASALCVGNSALLAKSLPDYEDLFVNDYADLLSGSQEQKIANKLEQVKNKTNVEITVLTIWSVSDYGDYQSIEPFATDLFNYWGIGDRYLNNGILFLVAKEDRKLRIELGRGYSKSRNNDAKRIIDQNIVPYFKKGEFGKGIASGVDDIIYYFVPDFGHGGSGQQSYNLSFQVDSRGSFLDSMVDWIEQRPAVLIVLAPIFLVLFFIVYVVRLILRNIPRKCDSDGSKMRKISEQLDDQYISGERVLEEMIGSVDYDVWICEICDAMKIERYPNWFSHYKACHKCGYKTLDSHTTVLKKATYQSAGSKQIDYYCKNCEHAFTEFRTIPSKTRSSSSTGSFGGGSSVGGGASGSW